MLPFVGVSYALANRKASVQRAVNLHLVGMETPSKAPFILQSVPGLLLLGELGAEIRGIYEAADRCFIVSGASLLEMDAAFNVTLRGTLLTSTGPVGMAWGTTQLVIVDGPNGYVLTLATNVFGQITAAGWLGSDRVWYLDGYFVFVDPNTQTFYISAIDDATTLDLLDFASAESSPDRIVSHVVNHRELWFLGQTTTEVWFATDGVDFPFARNQGAVLDVGCIATHSARLVDNAVIWLGRDLNGSGMVYRSAGYVAQRISTIAVEEALQGSSNLAGAVAWVYQINGQTFWCVNAPGLPSTWCFEIASNTWHERADLDSMGQFASFRVTCHAYALGLHMVGDATGNLYKLDPTVNKFGSSLMKRTRISPNDAAPFRQRQFWNDGFTLDCTTGLAPQGVTPTVTLQWSDDGGFTWGNPVQRTTGAVGNYYSRVCWQNVNGPEARDRIWRVDFADDAPFAIIDGVAK